MTNNVAIHDMSDNEIPCPHSSVMELYYEHSGYCWYCSDCKTSLSKDEGNKIRLQQGLPSRD